MNTMNYLYFFIFITIVTQGHGIKFRQQNDKYRPLLHFSIAENWINDPNGMVYLDDEYHLYYQYHPFDTVWGPMHWGHSVSTDLVHWTDLPIALFPDELGDIFSGSAVADLNNTSGFQNSTQIPIIAIFTHAGETQQQSIAYSLDKGRTYTKFSGNPVIPNTEIQDFRDPKVIRYNDESWILVLAAGNKVIFYKSMNLQNWEYLSEFGSDPDQGSHAGVWECPDLLKFSVGDEILWVLLVSINPGGPNGGSATQYFVGEFRDTHFISSQIEPLWMDWGVDNYAGVSFFNDPLGRNVIMGWMNNWDYANQLPTEGWRGQMTLPRVLDLKMTNGQFRLVSSFAPEITELFQNNSYTNQNVSIGPDSVLEFNFGAVIGTPLVHAHFVVETQDMAIDTSLAICFLNSVNQELCTGYDKGREYPIFLNREASGLNDFNPNFSKRITAKREISTTSIAFEIVMDVSAAEVLVDSGLTCMTALFYPEEPFTRLEIRNHANGNLNSTTLLVSAKVEGMDSIM